MGDRLCESRQRITLAGCAVVSLINSEVRGEFLLIQVSNFGI